MFWEASSLDPVRLQRFAGRLEAYAPPARPRLVTYPAADHLLPHPRDRLMRVLRGRASRRRFGRGAVPARSLGSRFAAFAANERGTRVFPSAGSLYPLEFFCLVNAAEGPADRTIVCYNADNHSLSPVGPVPPWEDYRDLLNIPLEGVPQLVFLFVLFDDELAAKYGARGGRFGLVEVGHAAQNLALRLVHEGMVGCEIGGTLDRALLGVLGLEGSPARLALAYACGLPAED